MTIQSMNSLLRLNGRISNRLGNVLVWSAVPAALLLVFCAIAPAAEVMRVKYVIDGDTVVLEDNRHLRYIGIDAPEIFHKEKKAQPFGRAARDYNQSLIGNQSAHLSYDREKTDAYHRLLAYVHDPGERFINRLMLLKGYAHCLYIPPNTRYHDVLLKAQRVAMNAKRGLWGQQYANGSVIGNIKTKRFHLPQCASGKRIANKNRVAFRSRWDAFWEGYAPCKQCLPASPLARKPVCPKAGIARVYPSSIAN